MLDERWSSDAAETTDAVAEDGADDRYVELLEDGRDAGDDAQLLVRLWLDCDGRIARVICGKKPGPCCASGCGCGSANAGSTGTIVATAAQALPGADRTPVFCTRRNASSGVGCGTPRILSSGSRLPSEVLRTLLGGGRGTKLLLGDTRRPLTDSASWPATPEADSVCGREVTAPEEDGKKDCRWRGRCNWR